MNDAHGRARRDDGRAQQDAPRLAIRLMPLAIAAVLLGVRLALGQPNWGSTAENALWGFGLLALVAALHLAAVRMPRRYAVEGAAWVATIIAAVALVVLLIPGGGR